MKKLILLAASSATFVLAGCAEEKQTTAVHHTHTVHHTRSSDQVNVPANNRPEDFEAVERPATYSR